MAVADPRIATIEDASLVVSIAARGFYNDPVMSWVFPDPAARLDQLHVIFETIVDSHFPDSGTVYVLDDACVSLWRSPSFHRKSPAERSAAAGPAPPARPATSAAFAPDVLERLSVLGSMVTASHPQAPHWYLGVLSTIPERQSQGLGARAVRPILAACDAEDLPAYLESSNARNIPFYQRQGFVLTGEIPLPGGPSLFPMWRNPQAN